VARELGCEPHPWQQHRADVNYELVKCLGGYRLAAKVSGTMVGRQAGKTWAAAVDIAFRGLAPSLPEVAALVGHAVGPQHIAFTAQDRASALGQWEEHVQLILASGLADKVAKVVRKNGSECLFFVNGSSYRIVTPSKHGARGLSLDLAVIDEALTHQAWLINAIAPTQAQRDGARSSFGAQLMIISNAGDENSELLNQQRELGRRAVAENDRSRVWLEYSCADDADPLDPAVWAATMPTFEQPDGISREFLVMQAETMGTDAFAREYLCRTVWSESRQVIAGDVWADLPVVVLQPSSKAVLAVEVTPDRSAAVIVGAADTGELVGVEIVDQRPGVDWVVDRVADLAGLLRCRVVVDKFGPAAPFVPLLERAGVRVTALASGAVADAAALFVDEVVARRVGHVGDIRFQDAVAVLGRRQRGDRWVFDRHGGDVSPIVAASLAVWLVESQPARIPVIH
jgi:hypothetical protein